MGFCFIALWVQARSLRALARHSGRILPGGSLYIIPHGFLWIVFFFGDPGNFGGVFIEAVWLSYIADRYIYHLRMLGCHLTGKPAPRLPRFLQLIMNGSDEQRQDWGERLLSRLPIGTLQFFAYALPLIVFSGFLSYGIYEVYFARIEVAPPLAAKFVKLFYLPPVLVVGVALAAALIWEDLRALRGRVAGMATPLSG